MSNDKNAQWHGGKGSYRRAENKEAYESNWDKIFGKQTKDIKQDEVEYKQESPTDRYLRHMESIRKAQSTERAEYLQETSKAPCAYTNMSDVPDDA